MAENWTAIAQEVTSAISEIGFTVTLRKPGVRTGPSWDPTIGPPAEYDITVFQTVHKIMDRQGTIIGQSMRTLHMAVKTGIVPEKQDEIFIDNKWHRIVDVRPLAPGGIVLKWQVDLLL